MTVWARVGGEWVTTHRDSDCMYCFFWGQFAEAMAAIDSAWAGKPAPEHPCTDYREDDAVTCPHADVRYCAMCRLAEMDSPREPA